MAAIIFPICQSIAKIAVESIIKTQIYFLKLKYKKWDINMDYNYHINVKSKYFDDCNRYGSDNWCNYDDVYNNIDIVIEFLLLNDFVESYNHPTNRANWHPNLKQEDLLISFVLNIHCVIISSQTFYLDNKEYTAAQLIDHVKEILNFQHKIAFE